MSDRPRPTVRLDLDEVSALARAARPTEPPLRATTKLSRNALLGLIDQTAPDDGVVDLHALGDDDAPQPATNKHVVAKR
jgi:hypothetical protein